MKQIIPLTWQRLAVMVIWIAAAAALRIGLLQPSEPALVWLRVKP